MRMTQDPRTWTFCPDCFNKGDSIEGILLSELGGESLFDLRFVAVNAPRKFKYRCPVCEKEWEE